MNRAPRHLADPLPLRRRWRLWTGVGLAVLLVLTAVAVTTTTGAVQTTAAQASGDGPKNLLANSGFEAGSQGGGRSARPG